MLFPPVDVAQPACQVPGQLGGDPGHRLVAETDLVVEAAKEDVERLLPGVLAEVVESRRCARSRDELGRR
jgi:hypothetical protein